MEFEKNVTCFSFETDVSPNNFSLSKSSPHRIRLIKLIFLKEERIEILSETIKIDLEWLKTEGF